MPKNRPAVSRPLVRYHDPYKELGSFEDDTPEKARRRRRRAYESEVEDRALDLIQNDPEVEGDMRKAKAKARELIALERAHERGELDVDNGTKNGKDATPSKGGGGATRRQATSPRRERPSAGRAARRNGFVTKSVRMVAAPYGSVASAAWTFAMGGLGIVIFYSLLQREGSGFVATVVRAIGSGLRNFTNPYTPLFPAKAESSTPAGKTKSRRNPNGAINKAIRHDPWPIRYGGPS